MEYKTPHRGGILEQAASNGAASALSGEFVEAVLKAVHEESIAHLSRVMNEKAVVE